MTFNTAAINAGLQPKAGKQAIKKEYREQIKTGNSVRLCASADVDKDYKEIAPTEPRWDYAVGFAKNKTEFVIWVEAHPASGSGRVDEIIKKLNWLKGKLKSREFSGLKKLTDIAKAQGYIPFRWIYNSTSTYRAGGKEQKRLAQAGMRLPERVLLIK